jgi:hypothetical protein
VSIVALYHVFVNCFYRVDYAHIIKVHHLLEYFYALLMKVTCKTFAALDIFIEALWAVVGAVVLLRIIPSSNLSSSITDDREHLITYDGQYLAQTLFVL